MNGQTDSSRSLDHDSKPGPHAATEVENKLKEAQSKLMEAEGRLMASTVAPASGAQTSPVARPPATPALKDDARPRPAEGQGDTTASGADRAREGQRKESLGARVDTAITKVSAEGKARMPAKALTENLPENVAGMLCYLFGWVSGLVFLLLDRRPFVRYHAAQSVALFATLSIALLVLGNFFLGALLPTLGGVLLALRRIVELGWLIAAVVLMLRASSGERYRVAGAAEYGDRAAHERR